MEDHHGEDPLIVEPKWHHHGDIICCSVISHGRTGPEWLEHFEQREIFVCSETRKVLLSSLFVPTRGVRTDMAIFRSAAICSDGYCTTIEAHEMGHSRGLIIITEVETTCLLREKLSNEDLVKMELWWIAVMHIPVFVSDNGLISLCVERYGDKEWISAHGAKNFSPWNTEGGFAYKVRS